MNALICKLVLDCRAELDKLDVPPAVVYVPFSFTMPLEDSLLFGMRVVYHMKDVVRVESEPQYGRFCEKDFKEAIE